MSFLEGIIYGFISGFTEFLPVSSQGHQAIMFRLFGLSSREPLRDLFVHIAVLLCLLISCKQLFGRLRREQLLASRSKKRRNTDRRSQYDLRLIKTAGIPLTAGMLFYLLTRKYEFDIPYLILFFALNGLLLIIPEYIRHGNKDARFMTGWDSMLLGLLSACSVLPGISRTTMTNAYAMVRGADRQHALNWILVLTLPVLVLFLGFDIINMFSIGVGISSFGGVISCLLSGVMAYLGGYFGILLIRFLTVRTGYSGFAYYSWGTALFAFVLYLIA